MVPPRIQNSGWNPYIHCNDAHKKMDAEVPKAQNTISHHFSGFPYAHGNQNLYQPGLEVQLTVQRNSRK